MRRLLVLTAIVTGITATGPTTALASTNSVAGTKRAICHVFGRYCRQALEVSYCETGGTYNIWSKNGQYLGLFQMGSHERATYGHGWNAWIQAKSAYRYFKASGYDWSPWSCKPW